jgi:hypothetical protein
MPQQQQKKTLGDWLVVLAALNHCCVGTLFASSLHTCFFSINPALMYLTAKKTGGQIKNKKRITNNIRKENDSDTKPQVVQSMRLREIVESIGWKGR